MRILFWVSLTFCTICPPVTAQLVKAEDQKILQEILARVPSPEEMRTYDFPRGIF